MSDENIRFDYFYGKESEMLTFYRIPKLLITDNYFKKVSNDAKLLYGLMLDRMSVSLKNGWLDEDERVYIYYSAEEIAENLNVGRNKALNLIAVLDEDSGIGLIERVKQGQGKPSRIYVKNFMRSDNSSEVYKTDFLKFKNQTSGSLDSKCLEARKSNPSNNNINNNYGVISNPILSDKDDDERMRYEAIIKKNIEYDALKMQYPYDIELLDGIYDLILETLLLREDSILIARNNYSLNLVKSKMLKLNMCHIEYVMSCFRDNTTKVRNIKKYMLASLFNAPSSMAAYYQAEVNHDMASMKGV